MNKKSNIIKNIIISVIVIAVLASYPTYAIIVWNMSKSPSPFSQFPSSDVWVCNTNDFTMVIDLNEVGEDKNYENMKVTISFNDNTYNLTSYRSSGHGTILAPVQPCDILGFECYDENCFTSFSVGKYLINSNDFYLQDVSTSKKNKLPFIKDGMDLHFIKN